MLRGPIPRSEFEGTIDMPRIPEAVAAAFELGYRRCEKGDNLQAAFQELQRCYADAPVTEAEIRADVFNPAESDLQYAQRRARELKPKTLPLRIKLERSDTTGWRVTYGPEVMFVGKRPAAKRAAEALCHIIGLHSYWNQKSSGNWVECFVAMTKEENEAL